jgi:hypothetical protein
MPYYTSCTTVCSSTRYTGTCQKTNTFAVEGGPGGIGGDGGNGEGYGQPAQEGKAGSEGSTNPCNTSASPPQFGGGGGKGADGKPGGDGGGYGQQGGNNGEDSSSTLYVAGGLPGRSVIGYNFIIDDGDLGGSKSFLKGPVLVETITTN